MSAVQKYINQQLGLGTWRSYDSALSRLRCTKDDDYKQILLNESMDDVETADTPIFACKFAQQEGSEHLLALANEDGRVAIHNTNTKERFGQQAHYNAIFDLAWMFQQMKIVTVSGDHTARLFDVTNSDLRSERIFSAHTRSVKTVAVRQNDYSVFATGGRDGSIFVWDTRSKGASGFFNLYDCTLNVPDCTITHSHLMAKPVTPSSKSKKHAASSGTCISGANSVTGLIFQNDYNLISCGAGDGTIKVWDLRKNYRAYKRNPVPKYVIPYAGATTRNGFSNLFIDRTGVKLYANCLDNTIYCYNIGAFNPEPLMLYTGHQNSTFYIKSSLSADGLYLISGSSDQNAYIWNTNSSLPLVKLTGHNAEVTCVAWQQKGDLTLVTCSDDIKHKIWRVGPEVLPDNWEVVGCGSAERVKMVDDASINTLKRFLEINEKTPHSQKKRIKACEKCNCSISNGLHCENCTVNSSKRKNLEGLFNENKRLLTDKGPRRLFNPISSNLPNESETLADTLEALSFSKSAEISPNHAYSPTVNMPNFAIDGCAPHLRFSPLKRQDKDWLTKLRVERCLIKEMQELAGPSPPKLPKYDSSPRSRTKTQKNRCSSPQSPLLKFFKVTNSAVKCDSQQCVTKSHNCTETLQHTQSS